MESETRLPALNIEEAVSHRYGDAAQDREEALCCPVDYDARYLKVIPQEVLDRDYGCGDPSVYVREGDTVLDLGSGGGKICFIASQVVGATGRVIGVDMNLEMLELARKSAPMISKSLGYANVEFLRGRIQDLALPVDLVDRRLKDKPVHDAAALAELDRYMAQLRREETLIPDDSIDIVVSNCVLNLVQNDQKAQLIEEIFRVVKPGGRIAISDIVSNQHVPLELQDDAELWSGCISGAYQETDFICAFENAGFHAVKIDKWDHNLFRKIDEFEFRSVTVTAIKPEAAQSDDETAEVIYRGPWMSVADDAGNQFIRGERIRVDPQTARSLQSETYADQVIVIDADVPAKDESDSC